MIGKMPEELMDAVLETIPLYIIVVDAEDIVVGWNKPGSVDIAENILGTDVKNCHPPNILPMVEQMFSEMKSGKRETATFWHMDKEKGMKLIRYYALRNKDGKYLGCLECDEYIEDMQKIKGTKMELD